MTNPYNRFRSLVDKTSIDVVTITAINGDGTSNAQNLKGDTITVKGDNITVGNKAFIRNNEIIRAAPNLTPTQVSV